MHEVNKYMRNAEKTWVIRIWDKTLLVIRKWLLVSLPSAQISHKPGVCVWGGFDAESHGDTLLSLLWKTAARSASRGDEYRLCLSFPVIDRSTSLINHPESWQQAARRLLIGGENKLPGKGSVLWDKPTCSTVYVPACCATAAAFLFVAVVVVSAWVFSSAATVAWLIALQKQNLLCSGLRRPPSPPLLE